MFATIILGCLTVARLSAPAEPAVEASVHDRPVLFVESFSRGINGTGWTWNGGLTALQLRGGNPQWYLRAHANDTFAPQAFTERGVASPFTGNYRARNVAAVGADFLTERVDFSAAERPLSLLLTSDPETPDDFSDDCTAYFLGTQFAPEPGEGWRSYAFDIDATSLVLPPGWGVLEGCTEPTPDAAWNRVIQDVDELRFFYGDPTFFFIFQLFTTGIDNIFISEAAP
jgi:hypothetical protein